MRKPAAVVPEWWTSHLTFFLVATGAVIGLANFWKFPVVAANNGGGAFVLAYVICLLAIGIPMVVAELILGRVTRKPITEAMPSTLIAGRSVWAWKLVSWLSLSAGLAILSLYAVVGGMSLSYIFNFALGYFVGASSAGIADIFVGVQGDSIQAESWMTFFLLLAALVSAKGIIKGVQRAFRFLMPLFFLLLIWLLFKSAQLDSFASAFELIFGGGGTFSLDAWIEAASHAFFTLALGTGVMVSLGSYMPPKMRVTRTAVSIGLVDALVALVAGLIIFPLLIAKNVPISAGFELLFHGVPQALTGRGEEQFVGVVFFVAVTFAAWSSSVAIMEPLVVVLARRLAGVRYAAAFLVAAVAAMLGAVEIASLSADSAMRLGNVSVFSFVDMLASKIVLPLAGVGLALYVGWVLPRTLIEPAFGPRASWQFDLWRVLLRWVCPICIALVFMLYWLG